MKSLSSVILAIVLVLTSMSACAGHRSSGYHKAKVVRTSPIYETRRYPVDEQVCWDEQVWRQHRSTALPTVAGAVIGGVLGNQVVHGDGRAFATVAGAAVGGVVGHELAKNSGRRGAYPVTRTRCEVRRSWRTEQFVTGWDMVYRYRGQHYSTWMPERPGRHIMVNINVTPLAHFPGY